MSRRPCVSPTKAVASAAISSASSMELPSIVLPAASEAGAAIAESMSRSSSSGRNTSKSAPSTCLPAKLPGAMRPSALGSSPQFVTFVTDRFSFGGALAAAYRTEGIPKALAVRKFLRPSFMQVPRSASGNWSSSLLLWPMRFSLPAGQTELGIPYVWSAGTSRSPGGWSNRTVPKWWPVTMRNCAVACESITVFSQRGCKRPRIPVPSLFESFGPSYPKRKPGLLVTFSGQS
mmetsp:Transcript_95547/g.275904  ORF Transcript_95547/g.275904 Transcript_95547/m.275904 type:complete len:233 (-) Transcript_95547:792-1490(-)